MLNQRSFLKLPLRQFVTTVSARSNNSRRTVAVPVSTTVTATLMRIPSSNISTFPSPATYIMASYHMREFSTSHKKGEDSTTGTAPFSYSDNEPITAWIAQYELKKQTLGELHMDVQQIKSYIAMLYSRDQNTAHLAKQWYEEALAQQRLTFGNHHNLTMLTIYNFGNLHFMLNNFTDALSLLNEFITLKKLHQFGKNDDSFRLNALEMIAEIYQRSEETAPQAVAVLQECCEKYEEIFGPMHYKTLNAVWHLALIHIGLNQVESVLSLFDKTLADARRYSGSADELTMELMNSTAKLYMEKLDREPQAMSQALSLLEECLKSREKVFGELHPITLTTLHDLGVICGKLNHFERSLSLLNDCLKKREQTLGERDPNTLETMFEYGLVCRWASKFLDCFEAWDRCLTLRTSTLGPDHLETIRTEIEMAILPYMLGRLEDALMRWESTYQKCLRLFGPNHPLTQSCAMGREDCKSKLKSGFDPSGTSTALKSLSEAEVADRILQWETRLSESRKALGEIDPIAVNIQVEYAEFLFHVGRYKEALVLFEDCYQKHSTIYGVYHPSTKMIEQAIESVRANM